MNKIIDELIDEIVLNFENNNTINTILEKVSSMRGKKVTKEGKTVVLQEPKFMRKIEIDLENKTIETVEKGKRQEENKNKEFESNTYYNIIDGSGLIVKRNIDKAHTKNDNYDFEQEEYYLSYVYYNEGKISAVNIEKRKNSKKINKHGSILKEKNNELNIINYYLIYNDYIQRQEINGEVNYYYFNKINDTAINKIEISEEEFARLVSYENDYYKILNDETFIKIRK